MPPHASEELADRLRPFATCFTAAIWRHVPVLVAGALLAPGRRTVTAALRVMALDRTASFAVYHRVLSTARWSARAVAHRLLLVPVATLVRDGPVVVGIDGTIERRWGARIGARGIHRDPVRSSRGHFVEASGPRWLCLMVMAPTAQGDGPDVNCSSAAPLNPVSNPARLLARYLEAEAGDDPGPGRLTRC